MTDRPPPSPLRAWSAGNRGRTLVDPWGRAKAYRPVPAAGRRQALESGLRAFERGDFFEAHEVLEPAWMGARSTLERSLYQGLIKLAAGLVHGVRGNARGVRINLEGARRRLEFVRGGPDAGLRASPLRSEERAAVAALARVDVPAVLEWIERALARLDAASATSIDLDALLREAERLPLRAAPGSGESAPT